ncbi:PBP1A family penicillin-binding protein [Paenibacillus sp. 453mf]|uniref:transglycosylase domain-containing protein n=1 Tax=Paenibacillus sp. 453mf TaxID=1761874 RepID=UPI0008E8EF3D|nr:PBP1A family penicillin-binding protein [Paenibacillus sp. 453mf]SFS98274.1 penicillin-binding protein, 1A family [Paenibacillus sp. 453mf]
MSESKESTKKKTRRTIKVLKVLGILALTGIVLTTVLVIYLYATSLPLADNDRNSRLFDINGEVIATFSSSGKDSTPVKLDQIAPELKEATIAVEDRKFYEHHGFDIVGVGRAILVNIKEMSMAQGASTLTQQLARNLYLTHEKTWSRKIKEAVYTAQLEMNFTKDEILQMYLNEIYYGHGAYGIEAASQLYFGKSASDLTLAESALLAGVPKGPTYYSPYNNMKKAKDRQKIVLSAMVDTGNITQAEADKAYNEMLEIKPQSERKTNEEAPYFRDYIRNVVINELGIDSSRLDHGGLNIYSTLDMRMQKAAEETVASIMDPESKLQVGLVSIDPRDGHVKAMVGGTNYLTSQYNHALAGNRQPASSFKPIMYLTAIESKQLTSVSLFESKPTVFHYDNNRKTYEPSNFGEKYLGWIDMRRAIAVSDNIYAVSTLMQIGYEPVIAMAHKLGITSSLSGVPSLALGTSPVSVFEMASAYSVLANEGQRNAPVAVLKITDAADRIVYKVPDQVPEQVVDPASAYVMTNLLESVFDTGGTAHRVANKLARPVAGKTGTTSSDAWMVGYTPELATAVWVGYDEGKEITTTESRRAAPIFAEYTEKALENVPPKVFPVPEGVASVYIDPTTGKLAGNYCENRRLEVFLRGTEPTEYCTEHYAEPEQDSTEQDIERERDNSWWDHFKNWWTK